MSIRFEGVFPVLPTPLREDQSPDLDGICSLAEHCLKKNVHGLVCLGSGGEFPYFSIEEKREIVKAIMSVAKDRIPVIVGNGCMSAQETIAFSEHAAKCGAAGFLMAVPTYYPVGFKDVLSHFTMVSKAVPTPILYYHYPENTRLKLSPVEIVRICEIATVVGIKETTLNLREVRRHILLAGRKPFSVLSGTSFLFLEIMKMGGKGVICPLPLVIPETVVGMYERFMKGDLKGAEDLERKIFKALPLFSEIPLPPGIARHALKLLARLGFPLGASGIAIQATFKEALSQMGLKISPLVRTPLEQIDERRKKVIEKVLKELYCISIDSKLT